MLACFVSIHGYKHAFFLFWITCHMATAKQQQQEVEFLWVDLHALIPHPRNYNQHPQAQIDNLKADILRFGQVKPIVTQACPENQYMIVAGHGVRIALQQLVAEGHKRFKRAFIVVVPASWTLQDILGYMVADNETAKQAVANDEELARLLEEQLHAGFDLATVGSSEEELQKLLDSLGDAMLTQDDGSGGDGDGEGVDIFPQTLHFGSYTIPLIPREYQALEARVKLYALENNGEYQGFVEALLAD